jgi:hypothetical protein
MGTIAVSKQSEKRGNVISANFPVMKGVCRIAKAVLKGVYRRFGRVVECGGLEKRWA